MQKLIELYEMVAVNVDVLQKGREKTAILKAQHALEVFEQAMESFKASHFEASAAEAQQTLRFAA